MSAARRDYKARNIFYSCSLWTGKILRQLKICLIMAAYLINTIFTMGLLWKKQISLLQSKLHGNVRLHCQLLFSEPCLVQCNGSWQTCRWHVQIEIIQTRTCALVLFNSNFISSMCCLSLSEPWEEGKGDFLRRFMCLWYSCSCHYSF